MVVLSKPVAAIALFISSVIAIPFAAPDSLESRQTAGSFYAITGVKVGGVQPRLEIRELQKLPEQWNLYILALTRFMAMDQKQRESFYQVSGMFKCLTFPTNLSLDPQPVKCLLTTF